MTPTRLARWAAASTAALALAGCGGEPESSGLNLPEYTGRPSATATATPAADPAQQALAAAEKAFVEAPSVVVKGRTGDGDAVNLRFRGEDGSGTATLGRQELRVIMVGGKAWYRGDVAFYEAIGLVPKEVAAATDARWIPSGSPAIASIDRFSTRTAFAADFLGLGGDGASGDVTLTPEATVDGVAAIGLTSATGTLFVDAATRRPIRLTASPGATTGGIAFSYREVRPPTPPSAADILDPAAFG